MNNYDFDTSDYAMFSMGEAQKATAEFQYFYSKKTGGVGTNPLNNAQKAASGGLTQVKGFVRKTKKGGVSLVRGGLRKTKAGGKRALGFAKKRGGQALGYAKNKGGQALGYAKNKGGQAVNLVTKNPKASAAIAAGGLALGGAGYLAGRKKRRR